MRAITVLIPDAEDPLALRAVRSLGRAPGIRTHLLTADRHASARYSRFCARWQLAGHPLTHPGRLGEVMALLGEGSVDVLLPVTVAGIELVSVNRDALAARVALPPLPDAVGLGIVNDKTRLACFARQQGVAVPPFLVFPDDVAETDRLQPMTFPVLAKPPSQAGGKGIRSFADAAALSEYLKRYRQAAPGERLLLQTYVPGEDLGLNVLCCDGEILAHTIQENPITAPVAFGPAAGIRFVNDGQVLELGGKLLAALKFSGLANIDLRRCARTGKIYVLDFNPRLWGTSMGSTLAGVNFPYLACRAALGLALPAANYRHITYADKSASLEHVRCLLRGRTLLPGLRFRHTSVRVALGDPLPMLVDNVKQAWRTRRQRLGRRAGS